MSNRLLVCGGRTYGVPLDSSDKDEVFRAYVETDDLTRALGFYHSLHPIDVLIHGNAKGADKLAGEWAERKGIKTLVFKAEWKKYGKRAGYLRNTRMLKEGKPTAVMAFEGGVGTEMMCRIAEDAS
ncbi:MAG TPA: DUF2493 domain-containing protein, partial [Candidatus Obscuribacterales bacterium]